MPADQKPPASVNVKPKKGKTPIIIISIVLILVILFLILFSKNLFVQKPTHQGTVAITDEMRQGWRSNCTEESKTDTTSIAECMSIVKKDISYCDKKSTTKQICKDIYYRYYGTKNKDLSMCNQISDEGFKQLCIISVNNQCSSITEAAVKRFIPSADAQMAEDYRSVCQSTVDNNQQLCANIRNPSIKYLCDTYFLDLNEAICQSQQSAYCNQKAIMIEAVMSYNPELCKQLTNQEFKAACLEMSK